MIKICHVTNAHTSDDFRIFINECTTLAKCGYKTYLVASGRDREENGVNVIGVGDKPASRKERMGIFAKNVVDKALSLDCDIYHLHDPELQRFIPMIARKGKKVIFDSHEDYKSLILAKPWIPKPFRSFVSFAYGIFERHVCRYLSGYVACYHWTKERVKKWVPNIELVFNYPDWQPIPYEKHSDGETNYFCYAGGIIPQWLHENVIKAIHDVSNAKYLLAGSINSDYGRQLKTTDEWNSVEFVGRLKHNELPEVMYSRSLAGICLLDYIPQCKGHIGNLSNTKLFEYMVNGIPVLCTDFDLWKEVIDKYQCGKYVNPHNVD
ncbi:MAG: glycosyltransferase, partial [Odoribacter sp.]|nr:glycosyltransferase [Odoribacter sp.]